MRIATPAQVARRLDRSISWRKKELTRQKFLTESASSVDSDILRRSGVTLLYAHWEGFIKDASQIYLKYLSNTPLELSRLKPCFVALAMGGEIKEAGRANKTSSHIQLVEKFRRIESQSYPQQRIPWKNVISTRSNLKSEVLREIAAALGLDYSPFELKEKAVIDRLVNFRNSVAHGEGQAISTVDYGVLHSETIELLNIFRDSIEDAAYHDKHLR